MFGVPNVPNIWHLAHLLWVLLYMLVNKFEVCSKFLMFKAMVKK